MVSFACKTIDFKDIVMCSFSLNKTEYSLFLFLFKQTDSLCASSIGEMLGKDRTTVQKAIKKLVEKELVSKHQINLQSGGYTFVYSIKNKEYVRQKILEIVNNWHSNVVDSIRNW